MTDIFKPVILEDDGVFGRLPNNAIINIGGTVGPSFTVGGRGVLFDDGTSSTGSSSNLSLNQVYINSSPEDGEARIKLAAGKDFAITDLLNNLFFKVDAETGKVTISGDVEILGSSTIIDTVIQDSDHWLISPKAGTTTALKIQPDAGVVPIVDLVSIRKVFGGLPVVRVDKDGNLILSQNLQVSGLINGVDVAYLSNQINDHISGNPGVRHVADDIDILPIANLPGATNVQQALVQLSNGVAGGGSSTMGFEHLQNDPALTWHIVHNKSTLRLTVSVYDDNLEMIIPNNVAILNGNTVSINFSSPVSGRAILILF